MSWILVVDPSPRACTATEVLLAGLGHRVSCVHTARDAFEVIRHTPPDLVIQEADLPDIDGLDLLGQIAVQDVALPIVLHTDASSALESFRSWGADAHVPKKLQTTAHPTLLVNVVTRLLQRRAAEDSALRSGAAASLTAQPGRLAEPPPQGLAASGRGVRPPLRSVARTGLRRTATA